jgi:hypothetical protein
VHRTAVEGCSVWILGVCREAEQGGEEPTDHVIGHDKTWISQESEELVRLIGRGADKAAAGVRWLTAGRLDRVAATAFLAKDSSSLKG